MDDVATVLAVLLVLVGVGVSRRCGRGRRLAKQRGGGGGVDRVRVVLERELGLQRAQLAARVPRAVACGKQPLGWRS